MNQEIHSLAGNIHQYLLGRETLGFSGAIIVGYRNEQVLCKGYGFANREKRTPFTPQTVQSNGSNTKQFTGAAVLLLESRRSLSVDDSLPIYFENIPDDKTSITLHQLLTHSSGLVQGVGYDEEPIEFESFLKRLMAEALEFEPGTGYNYSNAGYSLLAKVIEDISGVNYETFIIQNLLRPTDMHHTGYVLPDWKREDMAIGYKKGERWGEVYKSGWLEDGPGWHFRGNGGLHTTVEDMYEWLATVQGKGVLDEKMVEKWTRGYVTENNGFTKYGYGLVNSDDAKWGRVITHGGSNGIFTSEFFWLPGKEFFFYIHGNNSLVPAYSLADDILEAAFNRAFNFPPIVEFDRSTDPENIKMKVGLYQSELGSIELMPDDIRLIGKLRGQGVMNLMYGFDENKRKLLASLNAKLTRAMRKLENGDENAFREIVLNQETADSVSHSFLNRIVRMGRNLESLNVVGSFENAPGSKFHKYGPYTTFVHARFENWNQYWNLVWGEGGTYVGNYSGPWPEFILLPIGNERFKGVEGTSPWDSIDLAFEEDCLVIQDNRFCLTKD